MEQKEDQKTIREEDLTEFKGKPGFLLKYRKFFIILAHIAAFAVSLLFSFLLAHNMRLNREWIFYQYPYLLLGIIPIKLLVFAFFKQYKGWWRYVSITDLAAILRASLISTLVIVMLWFSLVLQIAPVRQRFHQLVGMDQSIFLIDMVFTFLTLSGLRLLIRLYYEEFRTVETGRLKRFLIIGAGNAGEALLREIHRMPVAEYDVIGFIDDDPVKQDMNIHGIPVLGKVEELPDICEKYNIEEVAIAMPSATHQQIRKVVQICEGTTVRFRTVPSITDIATGKFKVSQIRDVSISDLLGREAVELDLDKIEKFSKGKTILVTGAGGSIGSEMARQVSQFEPGLLLLVEQAENPLFEIERELNQNFPGVNLKALICDITDKIRVNQIFEEFKPDVVIHAAAHKHVPLMETNPGESIKNNVLGTKNVADAANKYEVKNFVMISTDKAVNPTSLMGSSKRIAELYIQDLNCNSKTDFVTVRFGNVLGSNGSVVPIFKEQIKTGGPVTVTHPEMQRYFMTIPEASQLVLQAATMGKGGEIFVLDMGEPVKIVDLARELITLSGFKPYEDIDIKFTGLRPGEKLFEELSVEGEDMQHTRHPKIAIWKNTSNDKSYLNEKIDTLIQVANRQDYDEITEKIKDLVPEYLGSSHHANA